MKTTAVAAAAIFAIPLCVDVAAQAAAGNQAIDLGDPGVLESLRDSRPDHYAKAQAILAITISRPDDLRVGPWIEGRFDATDVELMHWRVSNPPKLRLSFALDNVRYTADVVPHQRPARAMPARELDSGH